MGDFISGGKINKTLYFIFEYILSPSTTIPGKYFELYNNVTFQWLLPVIYQKIEAQITSLTWSDLCKLINGPHCNITSQ